MQLDLNMGIHRSNIGFGSTTEISQTVLHQDNASQSLSKQDDAMTERTTKPRQNANHSIKVAKQRYKSQVNQDQLPEVKIDENEEM